jgi:hypothetical protein
VQCLRAMWVVHNLLFCMHDTDARRLKWRLCCVLMYGFGDGVRAENSSSVGLSVCLHILRTYTYVACLHPLCAVRAVTWPRTTILTIPLPTKQFTFHETYLQSKHSKKRCWQLTCVLLIKLFTWWVLCLFVFSHGSGFVLSCDAAIPWCHFGTAHVHCVVN